MDTKKQEKKQEVLISIETTTGVITQFSKRAKEKNMTLGELALYALAHLEKSTTKTPSPDGVTSHS